MNFSSDGFGGARMQSSGVADPENWLVESLGGSCSSSGVLVNQRTALSYVPLYQAITLIADDLALLPVEVFRKQGDDDLEKIENNPIHKIWNVKPNPEMTCFDVRQTLMANCLLHGNGIGAIEFREGKAVSVWPLVPGSVTLHRVPPDESMQNLGFTHGYIYRYTHEYTGEHLWFFPHEVFHIKMLGDGRWGYSPLTLFRDKIGSGMALDKFQGSVFANGARPGGILKKNYGQGIPTKLSPEARANLRREWNAMHEGVDNSGKIAILTDGLEYQQMSMNNHDAEMLESMKYFREEIGAIYKIPPHKMGAMASLTFNNVAEQNRSYAQQCLQPYANKWTQECIAKLASVRDQVRNSLVVGMDFKELLRPDTATRVEQQIQYRNWGILTANEIRKAEGWDEIDGGDVVLVPSNMADAETGEPFSAAPEPPPAAPPEAVEEEQEPEADESMLSYAREAMHLRQKLEIKDLTQGINRKMPFEQWCEGYYSEKMVSKLMEPLEPLVNISGFVGPTELDGVVQEYANESFELVRGCQNKDQLLQVVAGFPQRVEKFINQLRAR